MKKKYIKPYLEMIVLTSGDSLLSASPLKISETTVSSGMVKDAGGDWGEIWDSREE